MKTKAPYDRSVQNRFLSVVPESISTENRTLTVSISSSQPADRGWFTEVLEHKRDSVDLQRAKTGAQLLFNHNRDDYLGVVEDAWVDPDQERCYAILRFDSHPLANQVFESVQNGIIRNVSIGYLVKKWDEENTKSSTPTYRVTEWELLEVSLVTVPADPSIGVGRQVEEMVELPTPPEPETEPEEETEEACEASAESESMAGTQAIAVSITINQEKEAEMERNLDAALESERERSAALMALGEKYSLAKDTVQEWIQRGVDLNSARSQTLELLQRQQQNEAVKPVNPLGLSKRESESYSIAKALLTQIEIREGKRPEPSLELEAHREIEKALDRPTEGWYVPVRDLNWGLVSERGYYGRRDPLQTAQPSLGGNLVDTELRSGEFIEALRNRAMISRLGARMLSGLQGNVDIPRQSGTIGTYWVGEGGTITESNLTVELISMRPKDLTALTSVTRRMLQQSSLDIEALIRADMIQEMALGIDRAAISGTGTSNQPLGILNYPGVNSVVIGANGGAPTWNHLVQLETEIAVDNADDGTCYYLTNARTRGKLKTTAKVVGQDVFLWQDSPTEKGMGTVNGYGAAVSNQVPSNGTKGTGTNLSSIIFGDFSKLFIGEWGVLEIMPNPYGAGYPTGSVQVRSMVTLDVLPRRPEYFAVCTDISTN